MHAVILAAGNGARLKGLVAAGMKPLLVVDGEALVSRLVRQARSLRDVTKVVVVVSPSNAAAVCDVVEANGAGYCRYVIQPEPLGPGEALLRGLEALGNTVTDVLVLLGDNIMPDEDVEKFAFKGGVTVGVRRFTPGQEDVVAALTRLRPDGTTVEKEPVTGADLWPDGTYLAWYGPLVVNRAAAWRALRVHQDAEHDGELYIGPFIPQFGVDLETIEVDTHDVGYR